MQLRKPKDLGQPLNSVYGLKYLWLNLSIAGINPPSAKVHFIWRSVYFVYVSVMFFLGGLCFPFSMMVNLIFIESWKEIIVNLSMSLTICAATMKQATILFNRKRLLKANEYLHQLDERCAPHAQDRMHVLHGIRYCHCFHLMYTSFYALCGLGYAYMGWTNHQLVFNAWFPVIFNSPNRNYVLAFFYHNLAQSYTVFQNSSDDIYTLSYVTLMTAHTRALADRIKRIGWDKKLSADENVQELKNCIQDHKNLQHYFDCIRPAISSTLFIQFLITGFILCLTAIILIAFSRTTTEKLVAIAYLVVILIEFFPACMCVTILMEETTNLTTAMYSCNWMDQSPAFRKMLTIFMIRSQMINVINAGNLTPVTLQTFIMISKFAFSMFTIINRMQIEE